MKTFTEFIKQSVVEAEHPIENSRYPKLALEAGKASVIAYNSKKNEDHLAAAKAHNSAAWVIHGENVGARVKDPVTSYSEQEHQMHQKLSLHLIKVKEHLDQMK